MGSLTIKLPVGFGWLEALERSKVKLPLSLPGPLGLIEYIFSGQVLPSSSLHKSPSPLSFAEDCQSGTGQAPDLS